MADALINVLRNQGTVEQFVLKVLEEAKILNKPIIITDTAAREAVNKYGKSIVLENDEEKIYDGLKQIIKDKNLSEKITQDCMYDNSKIIDKIVKLVGE